MRLELVVKRWHVLPIIWSILGPSLNSVNYVISWRTPTCQRLSAALMVILLQVDNTFRNKTGCDRTKKKPCIVVYLATGAVKSRVKISRTIVMLQMPNFHFQYGWKTLVNDTCTIGSSFLFYFSATSKMDRYVNAVCLSANNLVRIHSYHSEFIFGQYFWINNSSYKGIFETGRAQVAVVCEYNQQR